MAWEQGSGRRGVPVRTATVAARGQGGMGWLWIAGPIALLVIIGQCSTSSMTSGTDASAAPAKLVEDVKTAVEAQTPPPVQALSNEGVRRGARHERLAYSAEGLSGAMIYSQNCFDSLTRSFNWTKLDVCGGADAAAVAEVPEADVTGLEREAAYFQSETAAQRYLAAATGAGEDAGEADERLSRLQARVARGRPAPKPSPAVVASMEERASPASDQEAEDLSGNEVVDN